MELAGAPRHPHQLHRLTCVVTARDQLGLRLAVVSLVIWDLRLVRFHFQRHHLRDLRVGALGNDELVVDKAFLDIFKVLGSLLFFLFVLTLCALLVGRVLVLNNCLL